MNTQSLERQFQAIGAELKVTLWRPDLRRNGSRRFLTQPRDFTLDIVQHKGREAFSLLMRPETPDTLEMLAVDVQPKQRHLLLMAKPLQGAEEKRKFLCGHDERHWFVAAVPDTVRVAKVSEAMEALKPAAARISQHRNGVKNKAWNDRHNAGFLRQGEWFFLPMPDYAPPEASFILHDEPIQRGAGKPHFVEQLYRFGGTRVYVHHKYPSGLTDQQYARLLVRNPEAQRWTWNVMRRNPAVYALGKVRHPDHATLILPFWHRVLMSQEQTAPNVVFLD